jgi:hypothetical protein
MHNIIDKYYLEINTPLWNKPDAYSTFPEKNVGQESRLSSWFKKEQ